MPEHRDYTDSYQQITIVAHAALRTTYLPSYLGIDSLTSRLVRLKTISEHCFGIPVMQNPSQNSTSLAYPVRFPGVIPQWLKRMWKLLGP